MVFDSTGENVTLKGMKYDVPDET